MLNPLNLISKFIKSNNQKELDRIAKIVTKINSLENEVKILKDYTKILIYLQETQTDKQNLDYILCLFQWNGIWKGL